AHELDTPGGILQNVSHIKTTTRSNDLLPSINVTYSITPQLPLRGAITKTLARPNPQNLLPIRRINDETEVITDGNPELDVTQSVNYDLGVSYYLKPLGVASVGVFQKDIEGFYVSRVETITSGEYAGYQLTRPAMGTGGEIRG